MTIEIAKAQLLMNLNTAENKDISLSPDVKETIIAYIQLHSKTPTKMRFVVPFDYKPMKPYNLTKRPTVEKRDILLSFLHHRKNLSVNSLVHIFKLSFPFIAKVVRSDINLQLLTEEGQEFYTYLQEAEKNYQESLIAPIQVTVTPKEQAEEESFLKKLINLLERKCEILSEVQDINMQLVSAYQNNKIDSAKLIQHYYAMIESIYEERLEAFKKLSVQELESRKYPEEFKAIYHDTGKKWERYGLFFNDARSIFYEDVLNPTVCYKLNEIGNKWLKLEHVISQWDNIYNFNIPSSFRLSHSTSPVMSEYNQRIINLHLSKEVKP